MASPEALYEIEQLAEERLKDTLPDTVFRWQGKVDESTLLSARATTNEAVMHKDTGRAHRARRYNVAVNVTDGEVVRTPAVLEFDAALPGTLRGIMAAGIFTTEQVAAMDNPDMRRLAVSFKAASGLLRGEFTYDDVPSWLRAIQTGDITGEQFEAPNDAYGVDADVWNELRAATDAALANGDRVTVRGMSYKRGGQTITVASNKFDRGAGGSISPAECVRTSVSSIGTNQPLLPRIQLSVFHDGSATYGVPFGSVYDKDSLWLVKGRMSPQAGEDTQEADKLYGAWPTPAHAAAIKKMLLDNIDK